MHPKTKTTQKYVEEEHRIDFKNLNFPVVESLYNMKGITLTQDDQKGRHQELNLARVGSFPQELKFLRAFNRSS